MNPVFLKGTRSISVLFLVLMVLTGCTKSDDTVATPQTITDRILEDTQFSILRAAVTYAEMGDLLKGGNLTLFAPNDAAFQAAGYSSPTAIASLSKEQVRALLLYHVLQGPVSASEIPGGLNPVATADKGVAYINKVSDGRVFINNAQVIQSDIKVANGYIHSIDRVLTPSAGSLLTAIRSNPNLTLLTAAVNRVAGSNPTLLATLSNDASTNLVTVFAPNDAAFRSAGYTDLAAINAANLQTLTNVLLYHVVSGATFSNQLQTGTLNTLLSGNRLTIMSTANLLTIKGNKNATAATIKQGNIPANSGVIHIIDQLLLP
ncbi:fasciclin domain-containing protein [Spirosoma fluviale]|uniref:Uncaracterized surface protein containing fasciclin (FAS1) repeats n=1 Tax=Spirosoma fluviale TaxID=1597977 RepID=A0A286G8J8_9BACT|nr:fasciclin domain-containing protein [Spirosoma fluviale]SOD91897.1 Uncaracterized surface protein containing fasciclin (FAS1) repeats [Spirosoma fluviale]